MPGRRKSILIVDDDEEWVEILCDALVAYRTRVATNGEDGLRMARRSPPALIILDVMMPGGMDGFSALCELRRDPSTAEIPVLMCTEVNAIAGTSFTSELVEGYLGAAPTVFLEKPIRQDDIRRQVAALIGE